MGSTYATSASNVEYAQMTEALRWQQQRIIELEAENRELYRQLDDLRRGIGVSLIIEGRHIPLAASSLQSPASSTTTAPVPTPMPAPLPMTPHRDFSTQPPIHPTAHNTNTASQSVPPPERPRARHSETAFPEQAWLTDTAPGAKLTQPERQLQSQPARPMPHQGNFRAEPAPPPQQPQSLVPPAWLIEDAPTITMGELSPVAAPPSHQPAPAQRQSLPPGSIGPAPAEVWRAERVYESGKFPTLAQITGKHPAVSAPGKRKKAGDMHDDTHSPFTDSFVLG